MKMLIDGPKIMAILDRHSRERRYPRTLGELARRSDIGVSTVYRYVRDWKNSNPTLSQVCSVAKALGCSPTSILRVERDDERRD